MTGRRAARLCTAMTGGGIVNDHGTVTINRGSATITGNTAGADGGGTNNASGGTAPGAVPGRNVHDNTPGNIFPAS